MPSVSLTSSAPNTTAYIYFTSDGLLFVILKWHACVCWVVQSCPTLWNPVDCSPPGSSVHRIFQARILEWAAISLSRGSSRPRGRTQVSCVSCFSRQILYHWATWEAPSWSGPDPNVSSYVPEFPSSFLRFRYHYLKNGDGPISLSLF